MISCTKMALLNLQSIKALPHHKKEEICSSRAKYRDGRRDTAVKVYTINQESVYLLIQGVPAVGAQNELQALCEQYGEVDFVQPLDEYPCEEFTEVYIAKYRWFPAARTAKKHLDDKSFFGGTLHVCYAPEFETVSDTRQKLQERRKYVAWKTKSGASTKDAEAQHKILGSKVNKSTSVQAKAKVNQVNHNRTVTSCEPVTYIWAGKEYTVYPKSSESSSCAEQCSEPVTDSSSNIQQTSSSFQPFLPRQLHRATQKASEVIGGGSAQSAFNFAKSDNIESKLSSSTPSSTVNLSPAENCYSSSVESIKKKLLEVAVPNVRVSCKRKKRI